MAAKMTQNLKKVWSLYFRRRLRALLDQIGNSSANEIAREEEEWKEQ